MKKIYRLRKKEISGSNEIILDPITPRDSSKDWTDTRAPLGYDEDNDALTPLDDLNIKDIDVAERLTVLGDTYLNGQVIVDHDAVFKKDVYIEGTEHVVDVDSVEVKGDYLVLREGNSNGLGTNERSGLVIHHYNASGNDLSLVTDNAGTLRVGTQTSEFVQGYSNIWQWDGIYYDADLHAFAVQPTGADVSVDADEFSQCYWIGGVLYHNDQIEWQKMKLENNRLKVDEPVTDETILATLEQALLDDELYSVIYYRDLKKLTVNVGSTQPILTRAEADDLKDGQLLVWDAQSKKAVAFKEPTKKNQTIVSGKDVNDEWIYNWGAGAGSGGAVAHFATVAEWEAARLIPEGEDGYLAPNSLIIIDSEVDYLTGEEQNA